MSRRPETLLCNLILKHHGISRSSVILGSDSPQSNDRIKTPLGNSIHERPNVEHPIVGYLMLPRPTSAPALMIGSAVERRNQGMPLAIRPKIMARYEEAAAALG